MGSRPDLPKWIAGPYRTLTSYPHAFSFPQFMKVCICEGPLVPGGVVQVTLGFNLEAFILAIQNFELREFLCFNFKQHTSRIVEIDELPKV
jgi:hypothetical protein